MSLDNKCPVCGVPIEYHIKRDLDENIEVHLKQQHPKHVEIVRDVYGRQVELIVHKEPIEEKMIIDVFDEEQDKIKKNLVAAKAKKLAVKKSKLITDTPKAKPKKQPVIYTEEQLKKRSFARLRKIGYKLGTKGRSKKELVREILELQKKK